MLRRIYVRVRFSGSKTNEMQDLYEMFSFGEFDELEAGHGNFSVWELWLFILVGCMGGLIGACFNRFNQRLSAWRRYLLIPCR